MRAIDELRLGLIMRPAASLVAATTLNVNTADAVLVLLGADAHAKTCFADTVVTIPILYLPIDADCFPQQHQLLATWLQQHNPQKLYITGPSDAVWPDGYHVTAEFLHLFIPYPLSAEELR